MIEYKTREDGLILESKRELEKGDVIFVKKINKTMRIESIKDNILELEPYNIQLVTVKN